MFHYLTGLSFNTVVINCNHYAYQHTHYRMPLTSPASIFLFFKNHNIHFHIFVKLYYKVKIWSQANIISEALKGEKRS